MHNIDDIIAAFGALCLVIVIIIFAPFIGFIMSYFTGWLIKITFGPTLCKGLAILGLAIVPEQLPLMCGTLGVIGSFFKSITKIKNK